MRQEAGEERENRHLEEIDTLETLLLLVDKDREKYVARIAELEAALRDISAMTLRLIQSREYSAEASGCFCQIGRIAADALEEAGK